jgi:hypothetical protein
VLNVYVRKIIERLLYDAAEKPDSFQYNGTLKTVRFFCHILYNMDLKKMGFDNINWTKLAQNQIQKSDKAVFNQTVLS